MLSVDFLYLVLRKPADLFARVLQRDCELERAVSLAEQLDNFGFFVRWNRQLTPLTLDDAKAR